MSNAPHLKVNSDRAHHLLGILSGNPPDGIVYHSVSRGQPESFFNLDLPIKYAPYPELHGLKWRHKLPTNHGQTEPSQGRRCSTVSDTDTTGSATNRFLHLFISIIFKSTHKRSYTTMSVLSHVNINEYNDSKIKRK